MYAKLRASYARTPHKHFIIIIEMKRTYFFSGNVSQTTQEQKAFNANPELEQHNMRCFAHKSKASN